MSNEKTFILRKPLTALMTTVSLGALSLSLAGEVRGTLTPTTEDGISEGLAAENQQYSGTLIAAVSEMLAATASSGVPQGFTEEEWLAANAEVSVSNVKADSYTITLEASNLCLMGFTQCGGSRTKLLEWTWVRQEALPIISSGLTVKATSLQRLPCLLVTITKS